MKWQLLGASHMFKHIQISYQVCEISILPISPYHIPMNIPLISPTLHLMDKSF